MPKINISSLVAPEMEKESNIASIEIADNNNAVKQPGKKVSLELIV